MPIYLTGGSHSQLCLSGLSSFWILFSFISSLCCVSLVIPQQHSLRSWCFRCNDLFHFHVSPCLGSLSKGCHNRLPQAKWLKTTEIGCLRLVEASSLRARFSRALTPLGLRVESSPCPLSLLAAVGHPWYSLAYSCSSSISASVITRPSPCVSSYHLAFVCVCVQSFPFYKDTGHFIRRTLMSSS